MNFPLAPHMHPTPAMPHSMQPPTGIRWGLCCQFLDHDIRFRTATHRYVSGLAPEERRRYLADIVRANTAALRDAVEACHAMGIGAFRMNSQIAPLATHPASGYVLADLDDADARDVDGAPQPALADAFRAAGERARALGIRLSFHPDQFVVLNSERDDVVRSSVQELEMQAGIARLVGADVICLHAGGAAGGVPAALERLERGLDLLSSHARTLLAIENDDRSFAPKDLAPMCARTGVPMIYDAHHHRCHGDGLTVEEATALALPTWGAREPYFHLSSPRDGWDARNPRPHGDYVDPADFPDAWRPLRATIDIEAKDKERAVRKIMRDLGVERPGLGTRDWGQDMEGRGRMEASPRQRPSNVLSPVPSPESRPYHPT
jgi:UV DNA damage endonuclease